MRHTRTSIVFSLVTILGLGAFGCQGSSNDAGGDTPVDTRQGHAPPTVVTTIAQSVASTDAPNMTSTTQPASSPTTGVGPDQPSVPGTLPTNLTIPSGMTVTRGPTTTGNRTSATLSCSGRASTALTDLTAMLNNGGYRTKWAFKGPENPVRTAILEGTAKDLKVRAVIDDDAAGNCDQVQVSFTRPG